MKLYKCCSDYLSGLTKEIVSPILALHLCYISSALGKYSFRCCSPFFRADCSKQPQIKGKIGQHS